MNELDDKIGRYLSGLMTIKESTSFEKEIAADKDLRMQILLKKDLQQFFETRNPALNESLKQLGDQYFNNKVSTKPSFFNKNKFILIGIILISSIGISIYYFANNKNGKEQETGNIQVEETTILPESLEESEVIELPVLEEKAIEEKVEIPTFNPQKPINQPSNKDNQPIASVENYNENPILESLIRESVRSTKIEYLHESPVKGAVYKQNNLQAINLKIRAKVNDSETVEFLVYNNEADKFSKDIKSLFTEMTPVKLSDNQFQLNFNANVSLEKGLYYYIIQTKKAKEILYVSKFIVK